MIRRLLFAVLLATLAASVASARPEPTSPIGVATDTLRPTFTWTDGGRDDDDDDDAAVVVRYEVIVLTDRIGTVATATGDATSAVSTVDLPDDREVRWTVRSIDARGRIQNARGRERGSFVVATAPVAPTITLGPAALINQRSVALAWTGNRVSSVARINDAAGRVVAIGESPTGSGQVVLGPLADGAYYASVTQRNIAKVEGPPSTRSFQVDATPPAAPTFTATASTSATLTTPRFAWTGVEPGARATWQLSTSRGGRVVAPTDTTATAVAVGPVTPGSYQFQVRQTDAAGNVSGWRAFAFAVTAPVVAPTPVVPAAAPIATPVAPAAPPVAIAAPTRVVLPSRRPDALRPKVGARLLSQRPVLRWTPRRAAVRYNVQIFASTGDGGLRKVRSAFPRRAHYRLPKARSLQAGSCYVWRVWPFLGKRFARTPVGVSHFCVSARR